MDAPRKKQISFCLNKNSNATIVFGMPDKSHKNVRHVVVGFTRWIGSPQSIVAHTLLFAGCFFSAYTGLVPFDRMLLVLTTLVSLEAIYLAIFIQMSINSAT
jgi:hypothetical protein